MCKFLILFNNLFISPIITDFKKIHKKNKKYSLTYEFVGFYF